MHENTRGQKDQHSFVKFCGYVYFLMPTVSEFWDMVPQFICSINMFIYLNQLIYIDRRVVCIVHQTRKNANPQLGVHKNRLPLLFPNQHHFLNLPSVLAISSACMLHIPIRKASLSAPQHKYPPGRSAELLAPSLLSGTGLV